MSCLGLKNIFIIFFKMFINFEIVFMTKGKVKELCLKLCHACEELESNAKCNSFAGGGGSINVRNTHVCYIKFDFVRIFHKV